MPDDPVGYECRLSRHFGEDRLVSSQLRGQIQGHLRPRKTGRGAVTVGGC